MQHKARVELPQSKQGLGFTDNNIIQLITRYYGYAIVLLCAWLIGYNDWSFSWIIFFGILYLLRQRRLLQSSNALHGLKEICADEKRAILSRVDQLPSWVTFPDQERAEFLNHIIQRIWPFCANYFRNTIFLDNIEKTVQAFSSLLSDFKFVRIDLGDIAPRIGGLKVYTKHVNYDEIMMDVEIIYAGDAKIKFCAKKITAGIKNLQFIGQCRIVLKPLITQMPFFGALTYYFLRLPQFDFDLTDMANLMDIPGLKETLMTVICDMINSMFVWPNRQVFPIVTSLETNVMFYPNPKGVLRIEILAAKDLIKADLGFMNKGKSDPYVTVYGGGEKIYKSKVKQNTTSPEWNEACETIIEEVDNETITFELHDEDPGEDDFLGFCSVNVKDISQKKWIDQWFNLKDVKKGQFHARLCWFDLVKDPSVFEAVQEEANFRYEGIPKGLLVVFVGSAHDLPQTIKRSGGITDPNPFCVIKVEDHIRKSPVLINTTNPKFDFYEEFLVNSPDLNEVVIEIRDQKSEGKVIAQTKYHLYDIFTAPQMNVERQLDLRTLSIQGGICTVFVRFCLYVLKGNFPSKNYTELIVKRPDSNDIVNHATTDKPIDVEARSVNDSIRSLKTKNDRHLSLITSKFHDSLGKLVFRCDNLTGHHGHKKDYSEKESKTAAVYDADNSTYKEPEFPYGQIKLTIRYSLQRNALMVKVVECKGLSCNGYHEKVPDSYVKLFLLPNSKDRQKTQTVKESCNPEFDRLFEWHIPYNEVKLRQLCVSVKNGSPLFSKENRYIGDLVLDLSNLETNQTSIGWYALQKHEKAITFTTSKLEY